MGLTKTSELEAVNTLLSVIGEAPVNTIDASSQTSDVIIAKKLLTEVSREVQVSGWHFNREYEVSLVPDTSSNINLPTNTGSIDVEPENSSQKDYIQRGDKLYNKTDKTYTITDTLKCTITYMLSWDDLPQTARNYIMIRAARKFQDRVVGSEKHHGFSMMDEYHALVGLRENETDGGDFTIFDHYDVYRVIDRGNVRNRIG
jgi:hypothetical protein